jgi:hypothetical protein
VCVIGSSIVQRWCDWGSCWRVIFMVRGEEEDEGGARRDGMWNVVRGWVRRAGRGVLVDERTREGLREGGNGREGGVVGRVGGALVGGGGERVEGVVHLLRSISVTGDEGVDNDSSISSLES